MSASSRKQSSWDQKAYQNRSEVPTVGKIPLKRTAEKQKSKLESSIIKSDDKSIDSARQQTEFQGPETNRSSSSSKTNIKSKIATQMSTERPLLSPSSNFCSQLVSQIKTTRVALQEKHLSNNQLLQLLRESDEMILKLIEENDNLSLLLTNHIKVAQELSNKAATYEKELEATKIQLAEKNRIVTEANHNNTKLEERVKNLEKENSSLKSEICRLKERSTLSSPAAKQTLRKNPPIKDDSEMKLLQMSNSLHSELKQPEKSNLLQYLKAKYRDNHETSSEKTQNANEKKIFTSAEISICKERNTNKENMPLSPSTNFVSQGRNVPIFNQENTILVLDEQDDSIDEFESDSERDSQISEFTARDLASYNSILKSTPFEISKRSCCDGTRTEPSNFPRTAQTSSRMNNVSANLKRNLLSPQQSVPNKSEDLKPFPVSQTTKSRGNSLMLNEISPNSYYTRNASNFD